MSSSPQEENHVIQLASTSRIEGSSLQPVASLGLKRQKLELTAIPEVTNVLETTAISLPLLAQHEEEKKPIFDICLKKLGGEASVYQGVTQKSLAFQISADPDHIDLSLSSNNNNSNSNNNNNSNSNNKNNNSNSNNNNNNLNSNNNNNNNLNSNNNNNSSNTSENLLSNSSTLANSPNQKAFLFSKRVPTNSIVIQEYQDLHTKKTRYRYLGKLKERFEFFEGPTPFLMGSNAKVSANTLFPAHPREFEIREKVKWKNKETAEETRDQKREKKSVPVVYWKYDQDIPQAPIERENTKNNEGHLLKIQQCFEERPVWRFDTLKKKTMNQLSDLVLRKLVAEFAFFQNGGGPFMNCWIRFGYDPRKEPEAAKYQVVTWTRKKTLNSVSLELAASTGQSSTIYSQICDLMEEFPVVAQLYLSLPKNDKWLLDKKNMGWLTKESVDMIKKFLRSKK